MSQPHDHWQYPARYQRNAAAGREVTPASWAAAKRDLTWTTTTQLKSYLKLLSVFGVSNAVNKMKIDAIAARMRQHRIPLRCLEDAKIARDMLAAAKANDYGNDCVVESPTQTQIDALARLQTLPKVYARAQKSPTPGDGDILLVWWKGDIPVMSADGSDVMACASRGKSIVHRLPHSAADFGKDMLSRRSPIAARVSSKNAYTVASARPESHPTSK
jgi:hypothetical protein